MPKRPLTINIVPSNWQRRSTQVAAVAICLLVAVYGPLWLVAVAVLCLGVVSLRQHRQQRHWQLRWVPGKEGGWQWREASVDEWRSVSLRYTYLGPWLIGLSVAGQHHWVWPDSASAQERQALRRILLWNSAP